MPFTEIGLPFSGSTPLSQRASWSGAQVAALRATDRERAYLRVLYWRGPLTDHETLEVFGSPGRLGFHVVGVQSICSARGAINRKAVVRQEAKPVVPRELVPGPYRAKNTRWGLTAAGRAAVAALLAEEAA